MSSKSTFWKVVSLAVVAVATTVVSFADETGTAAKSVDQFASLASGLGIGIAAFGGSLGQAKAATAALEGIARNPAASGKIFVPMIIALALIESLVLYAFVVTFVKI